MSSKTSNKTETAEEAPARTLGSYATTWPTLPFVVGPTSQAVIQQIQRNAQIKDKRNPDEYEAARLRVAPVLTRNVHPSVSTYKAAIMDYLEGRALSLRSSP